MPKLTWQHGLTGYTKKGCRCDTCRAARRELGRRVRAKRRSLGFTTSPQGRCARCGCTRTVNPSRPCSGLCRDCWYVELAA